jgi:hypothetical protein
MKGLGHSNRLLRNAGWHGGCPWLAGQLAAWLEESSADELRFALEWHYAGGSSNDSWFEDEGQGHLEC